MHTGILIIAHAPLASALRACVLHVYPESAPDVAALDVPVNESPQITQESARSLMAQLGAEQILVLSDLCGATPCNVGQQVIDGVASQMVAGVNLPMLLRAVNYRQEPLDALVARALAGGTQCIVQMSPCPPKIGKKT